MTRPKPLWKADNQKDRLSELTAQSEDSAKDHSLRRDVRSLGALLGRVLVEQVGPELFNTVEELRRLMIRQLERLDRLPLTVGEALRCEQNIHAEIAALWQTDEVRQTKPTVNDEIRMGLRYFRLSLFETVPRIYAEVAEAVREVYGTVLYVGELPNLLSFGSWIGGDRDGNPLVKPERIKDALELARAVIFREYIREAELLSDCLSSSSRQAGVSAEILSRLAQYKGSM